MGAADTLEGQDAAKFASALAYIRNAPPEVETPVMKSTCAGRREPAGRVRRAMGRTPLHRHREARSAVAI